jgi:hypothetical protein
MSVSIVIRSYRQQIDGVSRKKIVKQRLRKPTPSRFSGAQEVKPKRPNQSDFEATCGKFMHDFSDSLHHF